MAGDGKPMVMQVEMNEEHMNRLLGPVLQEVNDLRRRVKWLEGRVNELESPALG